MRRFLQRVAFVYHASYARTVSGVPIDPSEGAYCVGRCFPARIGALEAAVVVPEVADYPVDKLELIAPVHVGRALGLQPGDRVTVVIEEL